MYRVKRLDVIIDNCDDCYFLEFGEDDIATCTAGEFKHVIGDDIPDWCPLPDVKSGQDET